MMETLTMRDLFVVVVALIALPSVLLAVVYLYARWQRGHANADKWMP